jgi:pimeloyl-ACP methyl ester carboxylesterase
VWSDPQRDAYLSVLRQLPSWMLRNTAAMKAKLGQLTIPTLVMWGEQDHILPIDNAQAMVAAQPGARLVTIARAGHLPHQEQPRAFLQAMLQAMTGFSGY